MVVYFVLLIVFFHLVDLFLTYKVLSYYKKTIINYYDLEVNYHKKFIKRHGLGFGLFLSGMISVPVMGGLIAISYVFLGELITAGLIGVQAGVVFVNYSSWESRKTKFSKIGDDKVVREVELQ